MTATLVTRPAREARSGGQLRSLTGLRWAAALVVFVYHVRNFGYFAGRSGTLVDWVFGAGDIGVSFFFVLSGFVLAYSARPGDTARRFWLRRFARIYPLHLVTALAALSIASSWPAPPERGGTTVNLLLISSWWRTHTQAVNPVSWSLTCEAFFYAGFPLLFVLVRRVARPGAIAALLGLAVAATVAVPWLSLAAGVQRDLRFYPPARLPEFVVGVLLARLVATGRWSGPRLPAAAVLLALGYAASRFVLPDYEYAACTVIGVAAVIAAAARRDLDGRPSLWSTPLLVRLGELSFAFYLVHILVMRTAQAIPAAQPGAGIGLTCAVFAVSLGLACALNEFVEVPARRYLVRRFG